MKKLLILLPLVVSLTLTPGCGTTPQSKATQASGIVVQTVDSAMKAWADYVRTYDITVPQSQRDDVHKAYTAYYNAQLVAKAALEQWVASKSNADEASWAKADAARQAAETALISLINNLLKH